MGPVVFAVSVCLVLEPYLPVVIVVALPSSDPQTVAAAAELFANFSPIPLQARTVARPPPANSPPSTAPNNFVPPPSPPQQAAGMTAVPRVVVTAFPAAPASPPHPSSSPAVSSSGTPQDLSSALPDSSNETGNAPQRSPPVDTTAASAVPSSKGRAAGSTRDPEETAQSALSSDGVGGGHTDAIPPPPVTALQVGTSVTFSAPGVEKATGGSEERLHAPQSSAGGHLAISSSCRTAVSSQAPSTNLQREGPAQTVHPDCERAEEDTSSSASHQRHVHTRAFEEHTSPSGATTPAQPTPTEGGGAGPSQRGGGGLAFEGSSQRMGAQVVEQIGGREGRSDEEVAASLAVEMLAQEAASLATEPYVAAATVWGMTHAAALNLTPIAAFHVEGEFLRTQVDVSFLLSVSCSSPFGGTRPTVTAGGETFFISKESLYGLQFSTVFPTFSAVEAEEHKSNRG